MGESVMGESVMGESEIMGESEFGMSEMAESEIGESVRGSFAMDGDFDYFRRESVDCRMSFNVIRTSFLYNDQTLN